MQQVTVGTKYQVVIPREIRQHMKGIIPGTKVNVKRIDEDTLLIKTDSAKNWIERTYGMMSEAWKNIDPIAEVKKGRDEWEERLKKLEKEFK